MENTKNKKKIEISQAEYDLIQEFYKQSKKQTLLLRVLEAEKNYREGNVSEHTAKEFIKNI